MSRPRTFQGAEIAALTREQRHAQVKRESVLEIARISREHGPEWADDLGAFWGIALSILAGIVIWGFTLGLIAWVFLAPK